MESKKISIVDLYICKLVFGIILLLFDNKTDLWILDTYSIVILRIWKSIFFPNQLCIIHKERRFFDPPFFAIYQRSFFIFYISFVFFFSFYIIPQQLLRKKTILLENYYCYSLYRSIFNLPKALRHLLPPLTYSPP